MNALFKRLSWLYRRYFKTQEFCPRADDSVISLVDQDSIVHFTYRDLGWFSHKSVQLNEHGRFSGRRCYGSVYHVLYRRQAERVVERKEYRCRILSSRPIDTTRM